MGNPEDEYTHLPDGAGRMWQNEFFYLDGTVTLTNDERGAAYGLIVRPMTWEQVYDDIGNDGALVPQYLTQGPGVLALRRRRHERRIRAGRAGMTEPGHAK
ncbi:hypothetical protein AB0I72_17465, partial [Nocardiopsis sp. NPDC049922]|uniref:hypothetical protein n=1 Tax=Nocardiopsis sp. NPDC049922 TaxID=3155157 RepID=UPI0033FA828E